MQNTLHSQNVEVKILEHSPALPLHHLPLQASCLSECLTDKLGCQLVAGLLPVDCRLFAGC